MHDCVISVWARWWAVVGQGLYLARQLYVLRARAHVGGVRGRQSKASRRVALALALAWRPPLQPNMHGQPRIDGNLRARPHLQSRRVAGPCSLACLPAAVAGWLASLTCGRPAGPVCGVCGTCPAGSPEGGRQFCAAAPFPEALLYLDPDRALYRHLACFEGFKAMFSPKTWEASRQLHMQPLPLWSLQHNMRPFAVVACVALGRPQCPICCLPGSTARKHCHTMHTTHAAGRYCPVPRQRAKRALAPAPLCPGTVGLPSAAFLLLLHHPCPAHAPTQRLH